MDKEKKQYFSIRTLYFIFFSLLIYFSDSCTPLALFVTPIIKHQIGYFMKP